jgi:hypothetical protein
MTQGKTIKMIRKSKSHRKTIKSKGKKIYSTSEYNSKDGMLTSVWGPSMWHVLHTISFNYPVKPSIQQQKHYRNFVLSLKHVLPCGKCRDNFKTNLKQLPLLKKHMKNRSTFSKYMYDIHELINKMLNKTSCLTYSEVRERYEHFRARCSKSKEIEIKIKENGCIHPLKGQKSKCVLKIVPDDEKCESFQDKI